MYKRLYALLLLLIVLLASAISACALNPQVDYPTEETTTSPLYVTAPPQQDVTAPTQEKPPSNQIVVQFNLQYPCYIIDPLTDMVVKTSNFTMQGELFDRDFEGIMEISDYPVEGAQTVHMSINQFYGLWTVYMKYSPSLDDEPGRYGQFAYALYAQELKPEKLLVQIRNIETTTGFIDFESCLYAVYAKDEAEALIRYKDLSADLAEVLAPFPV